MFLVLFLGSAIFSLLGQSPIVLGIIVLLFIPLTVVLKVQEGVITSCVILLHVFNAKSIDAHLIVNETLLLLIGLSIAFTMNLMMPSLDKQLDEYKCQIEQQIADIFSKYSYICEKYEDTIAIEFEVLLLNIKRRSLSRSEMLKIILLETKIHTIIILICEKSKWNC